MHYPAVHEQVCELLKLCIIASTNTKFKCVQYVNQSSLFKLWALHIIDFSCSTKLWTALSIALSFFELSLILFALLVDPMERNIYVLCEFVVSKISFLFEFAFAITFFADGIQKRVLLGELSVWTFWLLFISLMRKWSILSFALLPWKALVS